MENIKIGDTIKCEVTGLTNYGVFVKTDSEYTGLIHISEISDKFVSSIEKLYIAGDIIEATVIEIDEEKANPYFIKAFFESEQGIAALKSIVVGSTIPNIGVESLKSLKIPIPSLEEQNKIVGILDKFSKLIEILNIETILRSKQFNYYKDYMTKIDYLQSQIEQLNKTIKKYQESNLNIINGDNKFIE